MPDDLDIADVAAEILGTPLEKPESATEAIDFAARAAAAESELLAVDSGDKSENEKEEVKEEKAEAKLSPVQELVQSKYKGDEQAFINGLHESWQSNARMAKELAELKASLEARAEDEPVESPDINLIAQEIADFEAEIVDNDRSKQSLVAKGSSLKEEIAELKGERKRVDELDAKEIDAKIQAKSDKLDDMLEKWKSLDKANKKLALDKAKTERKLELTKNQLIEAKKSNNNSSKEQTEAQDRKVVEEFSTAVLDAMKENKLPVDQDEEVRYFYNLVKAEITHYMRTLPKDHPEWINGVNIPEFVNKSMAVHAKRLAKGNLTELTKDKLNSTSKKPTPNAPVLSQTKFVAKNDKPWDAKFAKARAAKILGG